MESKIQELTEKLLNEGVEKGRQQAQAIIDEANLKAQKEALVALNEALKHKLLSMMLKSKLKILKIQPRKKHNNLIKTLRLN